MHSSFFLAALSAITLSNAAPSFPAGLTNMLPKDFKQLSASCSLDGAALPSCALPAPSEGLKLSYVALGRGTQNYTCADSTKNSIPAANGAKAELFDASCYVKYAAQLAQFTAWTTFVRIEQIPSMIIKGKHFFSDKTTAVFDIGQIGATSLKKAFNVTAPANTNGDVPWLKLATLPTSTGSAVKEIYRVNTAKGSAPATCEGKPSEFTVDYAAEYWFYSAK